MTARAPRSPRAPMLTVAQAATRLGVDPREVYHWISGGLLPAVRYPTRNGGSSGAIRVSDEAVEAFLAAHRMEAS